MAAVILLLLFSGGFGLVALAQRSSPHAGSLERLGGLMLVSGLVGLGVTLARSAG